MVLEWTDTVRTCSGSGRGNCGAGLWGRVRATAAGPGTFPRGEEDGNCSREPDANGVPPDAAARPATLSTGTAKFTFCPVVMNPTTMPSARACASTNTPPLDPGETDAVNCSSRHPLPAPGTPPPKPATLTIP